MYFLNINKPKGISSFDVIRKLRKILSIKQIGHSGTLDPLASGVMQVAVGKATKLLDYLESDKVYIADIKFGYVSTTFDEEGEKQFILEPNFSKEKFEECIAKFIEKTLQTPPKYSAIKQNGKRLCDIIRNNPDAKIELKKREIEIYSIEILDFKQKTAKIKVSCKKGTYIRSLIDDIGQTLGCGAYMTDLVRIQAGSFKIENSNCLDDNDFIQINPLECLNLAKYELTDEELIKISHGNFIQNKKNIIENIILLTKHYKVVSLASLEDNLIKPKKLFLEDS